MNIMIQYEDQKGKRLKKVNTASENYETLSSMSLESQKERRNCLV